MIVLDVISLDEAAEIFPGRSVNAWQKAARAGRLRAVKVGRQYVTTREDAAAYHETTEAWKAAGRMPRRPRRRRVSVDELMPEP